MNVHELLGIDFLEEEPPSATPRHFSTTSSMYKVIIIIHILLLLSKMADYSEIFGAFNPLVPPPGSATFNDCYFSNRRFVNF